MPITTFSVTDGLDANRRSREHFTANIDVQDQRRWVPYADRVWFDDGRDSDRRVATTASAADVAVPLS